MSNFRICTLALTLLQYNHKDLKDRYSADTSFNFNENNANLLPKYVVIDYDRVDLGL